MANIDSTGPVRRATVPERDPDAHLGEREPGRWRYDGPFSEDRTPPWGRVPIFPELRPFLEEAFEMAEPGAIRVITRYDYNGKNTNLRTQLLKIIQRAGIEPWVKLWQNMRSTRETELCRYFPIQDAVKWIGNSEAVARKHYLQPTEEHFTSAATITTGEMPSGCGTECGTPSVGVNKDELTRNEKAPDKQGLSLIHAGSYLLVNKRSVGDEGLEPPTSTV